MTVRKLPAAGVEMGAEPRSLRRPLPLVQSGATSRQTASGPDPAETEVYRAAYLEGFDAGHADGDREARAALEEERAAATSATEQANAAAKRWHEALGELQGVVATERAALLADAEALALEVAFAALCHVLGERYADKALLEPIVRQVMAQHRLRHVQIRLAPEDAADWPGDVDGIECVADPSLEAGSCVVISDRGDVEAGLAQQLQVIQQRLLQALSDGHG